VTARLARIIDCYGKTPEQDKASYVLLEDEQPTAWFTEAQVTEAVVRAQRPARHWQIHTKDGWIHDFHDAVRCELGQAWGVGPWSYRLWDRDGETIAEFLSDNVQYVRQV
jgi:hypothetical protein